MKPLLLFSCLILACTAEARVNSGDGVIVGNGAGFVEQNFQYAYSSLDRAIQQCLHNPRLCRLDGEDAPLLENILEIARQNASNPERLLFVSERDHPNFFATGPNESHRIAKTGLTPSAPIYVNTDSLYENGKPALNLAAIMAILVHEIGHQTGEEDHRRLDLLGAKIRRVVEANLTHHEHKSISIDVINYSVPHAMASLYVSRDRDAAVDLSRHIFRQLRCGTTDAQPSGYRITNGHWFLAENKEETGFRAWVEILCMSRKDGLQYFSRQMRELSVYIGPPSEALRIEMRDL